MNNSFLATEFASLSIEEPVDIIPELREREGELVRIIDALNKVSKTKEWAFLKEKLFDGMFLDLEDKIRREVRKDAPDLTKINRLVGQSIWSERYADLSKLSETYRLELTNIRLKLYGKTPKN